MKKFMKASKLWSAHKTLIGWAECYLAKSVINYLNFGVIKILMRPRGGRFRLPLVMAVGIFRPVWPLTSA